MTSANAWEETTRKIQRDSLASLHHVLQASFARVGNDQLATKLAEATIGDGGRATPLVVYFARKVGGMDLTSVFAKSFPVVPSKGRINADPAFIEFKDRASKLHLDVAIADTGKHYVRLDITAQAPSTPAA